MDAAAVHWTFAEELGADQEEAAQILRRYRPDEWEAATGERVTAEQSDLVADRERKSAGLSKSFGRFAGSDGRQLVRTVDADGASHVYEVPEGQEDRLAGGQTVDVSRLVERSRFDVEDVPYTRVRWPEGDWHERSLARQQEEERIGDDGWLPAMQAAVAQAQPWVQDGKLRRGAPEELAERLDMLRWMGQKRGFLRSRGS